MILSNGVEPIDDDLPEAAAEAAKFAAILAAAWPEAVALIADVACAPAEGLGNCGTFLSEVGQPLSFLWKLHTLTTYTVDQKSTYPER